MTREEFGRIALAISKYYARHNILDDEESIRLWFEQLKDLDYQILSTAISRWVQVQKWPPTIADLREMCQTIKYGEPTLWVDEWEKVCIAVRSKYGRYMEREALESFNPITRQVVSSMGWKNLCDSDNPTADRAQFERMYEKVSDTQRMIGKLSPALKKLIDQTQNQLEAKE